MADLAQLRKKEYTARREANRLRRAVFEDDPTASSDALLDELKHAEIALHNAEQARANEEVKGRPGVVVNISRQSDLLGPKTTGLDAKVELRMEHVPVSIYHLLDAAERPLVHCTVSSNETSKTRRVRVTSFIEGFTAKAVDTVELRPKGSQEFPQLPTIFPERSRSLTEMTKAMLNVLVEDLDGAVEMHTTRPLWLLARTAAPLAVKDPTTASWVDMSPYLGAYVTPNAPPIMAFLRVVADHHPQKKLVGYQDSEANVEPQVRAIFDALKADANITYVNSLIAFEADAGLSSQRIRTPSESLEHGQANCIDGTVLYASLLEAASLNPAIVLIPGHAFVGYETWKDSGEWRYLETTMTGSGTFEQASEAGDKTTARWSRIAEESGDALKFRRWSVAELRSERQITPME